LVINIQSIHDARSEKHQAKYIYIVGSNTKGLHLDNSRKGTHYFFCMATLKGFILLTATLCEQQ